MAQSTNLFVGYDQFCGVRVEVGQTKSSAEARFDALGRPIILVDPSVISGQSWPMIFTLAHECGHHARKHLSSDQMMQRIHMNATRRQELEADCFAAEILSKHPQYLIEIKKGIAFAAGQGGLTQGPYPTGFERAAVMAKCGGIGLLGAVAEKDAPKLALPSTTPYGYRSLSDRKKIDVHARLQSILQSTFVGTSPNSWMKVNHRIDRWGVRASKSLCELQFFTEEYPDSTDDIDFADSKPVIQSVLIGSYSRDDMNSKYMKLFLAANLENSRYRYMKETMASSFSNAIPKVYEEVRFYPTLYISNVAPKLREITFGPKGDANNVEMRIASLPGSDHAELTFTSSEIRETFREILLDLASVCGEPSR
jgi:hypothetical protein